MPLQHLLVKRLWWARGSGRLGAEGRGRVPLLVASSDGAARSSIPGEAACSRLRVMMEHTLRINLFQAQACTVRDRGCLIHCREA